MLASNQHMSCGFHMSWANFHVLLVSLQEVLGTNHQYDGKAADVWSCGVHLYVMLVGAYPFDDPRCPGNITTIVRNIKMANYHWPRTLQLTDEVKDLVNRILVPHSEQRITIDGIMQHPWYLKNLPDELRVCQHSTTCVHVHACHCRGPADCSAVRHRSHASAKQHVVHASLPVGNGQRGRRHITPTSVELLCMILLGMCNMFRW